MCLGATCGACRRYVRKGSVVVVLAPVAVDERQALLEAGKAGPLTLRNISLHHVCASPTIRRDIEAVMRACAFSSVLVLAAEGGGDQGGSSEDSRALTTLLLVRDIRHTLLTQPKGASAKGGFTATLSAPAAASVAAFATPSADGHVVQSADFTLLGEILDVETKDLVAAAGVSDYIMSNRLMSKVMAMVAEEPSIGPLFEQLFAEEGDEIYVRDVRCYCAPQEELSFWQIGARARTRGDVAIGYKRRGCELELNPPNKTMPIRWEVGDYIVVIGDEGEDANEAD